MLRSIVEGAVAAQPDLRLAADSGSDTLEDAVARTKADVLIAPDDRPEASFRSLLVAQPALKVFVLTKDGRRPHAGPRCSRCHTAPTVARLVRPARNTNGWPPT